MRDTILIYSLILCAMLFTLAAFLMDHRIAVVAAGIGFLATVFSVPPYNPED